MTIFCSCILVRNDSTSKVFDKSAHFTEGYVNMCVTGLLLVDSLWQNGVIWCHGTWSSLVKVIDCHLFGTFT